MNSRITRREVAKLFIIAIELLGEWSVRPLLTSEIMQLRVGYTNPWGSGPGTCRMDIQKKSHKPVRHNIQKTGAFFVHFSNRQG